jgi:hypothetical protein
LNTVFGRKNRGGLGSKNNAKTKGTEARWTLKLNKKEKTSASARARAYIKAYVKARVCLAAQSYLATLKMAMAGGTVQAGRWLHQAKQAKRDLLNLAPPARGGREIQSFFLPLTIWACGGQRGNAPASARGVCAWWEREDSCFKGGEAFAREGWAVRCACAQITAATPTPGCGRQSQSRWPWPRGSGA